MCYQMEKRDRMSSTFVQTKFGAFNKRRKNIFRNEIKMGSWRSTARVPHRLEPGMRDQPSQDSNSTVLLCKSPPSSACFHAKENMNV